MSTLLFQKVANMEYYLLDQSEQKFFPTDLKAKYARGKFLFQLALQHYHDAFHTFLQKAFMCFKTAFRILLDNLDTKAQENSPSLLLRTCFVQLLVTKKQRVRFVQATIRRHRVALRACFWRLVMWRWQRVQSVKRSVKVSLMIRRTTLRNCLWRWETFTVCDPRRQTVCNVSKSQRAVPGFHS